MREGILRFSSLCVTQALPSWNKTCFDTLRGKAVQRRQEMTTASCETVAGLKDFEVMVASDELELLGKCAQRGQGDSWMWQ